ncbi:MULTISPECIES: nitrite reductase [Bacillaceae]|uniref:nitrite reductase n=1 Tax=Bacillaceae TaxID=186817 RepID=UPI000BFA16E2|nr:MULTISPECIES: nitrite reductase [Bacillaceae]PET42250.1 nitrite reductase [Bacillus sp. AFS001701]
MEKTKKITIAVNGGISFGAKLNAKQLVTIAKHIGEEELELTTFQQLYIDVPEERQHEIINEFISVGLHCYPVGDVVKSLRTCNFCKGELEEGMPVAKELNNRIAGKEVPFTVRAAYTGCPVGCGEPLMNDIGIMKVNDHYNFYIGGKSKGKDAEVAQILYERLEPDQLYYYIERFLDVYKHEGKKRETVNKFIKRIGIEELKIKIG